MALKSIKSVIDGSFSEEAVKSRPERKKTGFKRLDPSSAEVYPRGL